MIIKTKIFLTVLITVIFTSIGVLVACKSIWQTAVGLSGILIVYWLVFMSHLWWNQVEPPDDGGKKRLKVVKDNDPATSFFYGKNTEKQYNYTS